MKAKMLKIAGVKSEAAFYKKFPNQEAFMKVHGKEFKKAQLGAEIEKAQFGGNYNLGQTPNFQTPNAAEGFMPNNSFSMATPKLNLFDPQGDQSQTKMAQGIFSGAYSVEDSPFGKKGGEGMKGMDAMDAMNTINGITKAAGALSAEKDLMNKTKAWSGAANVVKRSLISNAALEKPKNEWFRQDDVRFIKNADELYNTQGRGTDVLTQNGGILQGGGEIQNTFAPNTLYDDLEYEPITYKNYQGGGGFGNQTIPFGGGGGEGMNYTSNAGAQMGGAMFGNIPGLGTAATLIGGALDPYPKKTRGYQNNINSVNAFASRLNTAEGITGGLSNMGVGQNGQALQPYEDGGWVSHDWQPQVIASFGGLDEQEVYDYAHEGMDTLRAGGHMRDYTPVSNRGMETYAMGGQLKTHGVGEVETISYNPYMPGSGEMSMLRGPSHKDGGIDISYGNAQNGSIAPQVNAEGGEPIIEMQEGGQMDPRTGQPSVEAVVLGNIPASLTAAKATGDETLINLFTKYDGKTIKSIGNSLAKDNQKTEKYKNTVSKIIDDSDKTPIGMLKNKTAEMIDLAIKTRYKQNAQEQMKLANWQSAVNDIKDERSAMIGRNLSAEDLGKGIETYDYDPITKDAEIESPYAKHGAYLRKAQTGDVTTSDNPDDIRKLQDMISDGKGKEMFGDEYGKIIGEKTRKQLTIKDSEQIVSNEENNRLNEVVIKSNKTPNSKTSDKTLTDKKDIDVVPLKQNKIGMYANMLSDFLRNNRLPGIDPRQFAGEYMAMAQNQYEPVPMQQASLQLDPMTRISYEDIRNQNTADFRDAERNMAYNPSAIQGLLGKKYLANQQGYGEEFRTNQGLEDKIYGGNRAKVNQEQLTNLQLNANQMDKQSIAKSKTKETNQKAIASIADKYMQHDARNLEYNVKSNLFPTYGYDASGKIRTQGPGYQPNIPQVYGGKGTLKQVPVYDANGKLIRIQMQEEDPNAVTAITKNGGSINKKNKGSVVKNAKNGSLVKLHKNF